jgi:hypothetical protein
LSFVFAIKEVRVQQKNFTTADRGSTLLGRLKRNEHLCLMALEDAADSG